MIISASRRTDVPAYFSEWFFNRLKARFVFVPNPFNSKMISKISLHPDVVDCIVFWTKNPAPMLEHLKELQDYPFYFQLTLNPYGKEIEPHLPVLEKRIATFKRLADRIGRERVIWRYDPVFTNQKYDVTFHKEAFAKIAFQLKEHTDKCMLGFIDHYPHIRAAAKRYHIDPLLPEEMEEMAMSFLETAHSASVRLETCTVKVDLSALGIPAGMCVDKALVERLAGYPISAKKDKNQRNLCQCTESIDIGTYDTCLNGCIYCYAVKTSRKLSANFQLHDKNSPKLLGQIRQDEVIKERNVYSLREEQLPLF